MKKIIYKIILFFVPIIIIAEIIFFIPATSDFKIAFLKEDCSGRYNQIENRLSNKKNIDILFLGSSKTMNGINDSLIESLTGENCYNAGYCRYGRNLEFLIAKKYVQAFKIKKLIIEVREEEAIDSHPVFPQIATSTEILSSFKSANTSFINDCFSHFLFNLSYIKHYLDIEIQPTVPNVTNEIGFFNNSVSVFDTTGYAPFNIIDTMSYTNIKYCSANYYLSQFSKLCQQNQIKLYFVYLPNYNAHVSKPIFAKKYRELGNLILAPDSIYTNLSNYTDNGHFTKVGSNQLSHYISAIIAQ